METPSRVNTRSLLSVAYPKRQIDIVVYRLFEIAKMLSYELVDDVDLVSVVLELH